MAESENCPAIAAFVEREQEPQQRFWHSVASSGARSSALDWLKVASWAPGRERAWLGVPGQLLLLTRYSSSPP
jgi:hypothetical protein